MLRVCRNTKVFFFTDASTRYHRCAGPKLCACSLARSEVQTENQLILRGGACSRAWHPVQVEVRWYRAPEGAPWLPFWHRFGSGNWARKRVAWPGTGEVLHGGFRYDKGKTPLSAKADHICGTLKEWQEGCALPCGPVQFYDDESIPGCCHHWSMVRKSCACSTATSAATLSVGLGGESCACSIATSNNEPQFFAVGESCACSTATSETEEGGYFVGESCACSTATSETEEGSYFVGESCACSTATSETEEGSYFVSESCACSIARSAYAASYNTYTGETCACSMAYEGDAPNTFGGCACSTAYEGDAPRSFSACACSSASSSTA